MFKLEVKQLRSSGPLTAEEPVVSLVALNQKEMVWENRQVVGGGVFQALVPIGAEASIIIDGARIRAAIPAEILDFGFVVGT